MEFTAKELKTKLWNVLVALEEKKMDYRTANSMVGAAREIIHLVRTEIEVVRLSGQPLSSKLLGD